MDAVVRCPHCDGLSRVPAGALGQALGCPRCGGTFTARAGAGAAPPPRRRPPDPRPIPVVRPVADEPEFDPGHDHGRHGPASALIGLALLPLGIPLLWTAVLLLSGVEPVFSYALPVAIAVGVTGVCLGVVVAADWSHPTRVKGILTLVLIGYAAAAFLYFVQKDWLEAARKRFTAPQRWHEFKADDGSFSVRLPGKPAPAAGDAPLPGWDLRAVRYADPKQRSTDVYVVAYGPPPAAAAKLADDAWFAAVKAALAQAAGGTEPAETPVTQQGHPGREFALELPDKVTNRTVRVFRVGRRAFYLAVDGVALPPDAQEVRKFFDSFYLKPGT